MVDERQVTFPNANYPGGPQPPQMSGKPGYQPSHSMRGTLSPNVTIGMPKKPAFRQQEEGLQKFYKFHLLLCQGPHLVYIYRFF